MARRQSDGPLTGAGLHSRTNAVPLTTRSADPEAGSAYGDFDVAAEVRPLDPHALFGQHRERAGRRVAEVVGCAHTDERDLRVPQSECVLGESIGAPVVRDLEHLDRIQISRRHHALLCHGLRVAREDRVEGTAGEMQHDTRVVRLELDIRFSGRPQHFHPGAAY